MTHLINEIWKDKEGSKTVWKLQAPRGILTFYTKKRAEEIAEVFKKETKKSLYLVDINDNCKLYFVIEGTREQIDKLADKIKNDGGNFWIANLPDWNGYFLADCIKFD